MLFTLQFPIADVRAFLDRTATGKLSLPVWPDVQPYTDFVRSVGAVTVRRRGGLTGWIGENFFCEANRAISFPTLFLKTGEGSTFKCHIAFRRFYFDGFAVGKFEMGLGIAGLEEAKPSATILKHLFQNLLDLPVLVRKSGGGHHECPFYNAGKHLAALYEQSSTKHAHGSEREAWWVRSQNPVLFVSEQPNPHDAPERGPVPIPYWGKTVPTGTADIHLGHYYIQHSGKNLRMWVTKETFDSFDEVRELRIFLLRLHAERECFLSVLKDIEAGRIDPPPKSEASDKLQRYLLEVSRRLTKLQKKSEVIIGEVGELAYQAETFLTPGWQASIERRLDSMGIRPNVKKEVLGRLGEQVTIGKVEVIMGDNINIGDINNSIVNIKSVLVDVKQKIQNASSIKDAQKTELETLTDDLEKALEEVAKTNPNGAERVAKAADMAVSEATREKPDRDFLNVSAEGLKAAARAVADIAPTVLAVATTIAKVITGIP